MRTGATRRGRAACGAAVRAAAMVATLVLPGCAEKITTVDPSFTSPEGVATTQTGLAVWREIPNGIDIYTETDPPVLLRTVIVPSPIPGQVHGLIRDSTTANGYQVFRREPNGGYRELYEFNAFSARRWFDRDWEIFTFTDADTIVPTHTYLGRGLVGGRATIAAPLTNEASGLVRAVENITYTGLTGYNSVGNAAPLDSLFQMKWLQVQNAVAYFIHVYQWSFNLIRLEEQVASGMPAPLFIGKSRDILVAYLPAPAGAPGSEVTFTMPTPNAHPPEARIMTVRETRYGQVYLVRIAAVNALGELIAYTYGTYSQEFKDLPDGTTLPSSQFAVFRMGAIQVAPSRPVNPAPARALRAESLSP